jgi:phosphatidylglycerol:prolipoprotein diacylglycerol transferase
MRPLLFRWRNLSVWSYPAMLYLGLVTGVVAGNIAAHAAGIDAFRAYLATIILIVPALIGARLWYVASQWKIYRRAPRRIWNRREGGYIMYGGLPAALLLSIPLLRGLRLSFGAFWDVATFTILIGMIFARVGCLMNGCCAGKPSRTWFSLYLPNHQGVWGRRIPTQCLEAAWAAVLLLSGIVVWPRLPLPGALFLLVALGYASGRFGMEFLREREPEAGRFTLSHVISLVTVVLSISTLTIYWRQ